MYSPTVMDHFANPRNMGAVAMSSASGLIKSPIDKDIVLITLRIEDDIISDIRFKCTGCVAAIAGASITTEMVKGKTVRQAYEIRTTDVVQALGGLPEYKLTCSRLAPEAVRLAIDGWRQRKEQT